MLYTKNNSVREFNIECIKEEQGLEIQTLWFQISPEPMNLVIHL